ncbi:SH3 domain-containing protein, partial [uncultured Clostridium sp.]|uniref:SH3 domain-containing protein n=1 Tax=uncultured Clostridium sp. TaxID=59620 RepID=UPI002616286F
MKNKKISMLIAMTTVGATILLAGPTMTSFASTINTANTKVERGQAKNTQKIKGEENQGGNQENKSAKGVSLEQVNIFTGKVVKNPQKARTAPSSFAVTFNGSDNMKYYNGKNVEPNNVQTEFHSKTQAELYNYLMNPNNRWAAEDEAIGLHGGDAANTCVFFVSSALRGIGVNIPDSIGYTTNLMNELQNLGWEKETDLSTLEPGDICFASTAHTYVFMGWANKAEGIAWIADNQFTWFGTDFHPRTQASVPDVDVSPTTCYYRLPGKYSVEGNSKQVDMPVNYNYSVGVVGVQGLHVRTEPSTNSQILADLNYGKRIEILSKDGNWLKIMYNGQLAYVWAGSVSGAAPSVKEPYNAHYKVIGTGKVDFSGGNYTDIMSGGTWYSNVRGTLNNGEKVSIINQNDNWYQIEYQTGTAWIPKDRLSTSLGHTVIGTGTVAFSDLSYTDIM